MDARETAAGLSETSDWAAEKRGTPNKRDQVRQELIMRAYETVITKLPDEIHRMTPLEGLLLCMHWSIEMKGRDGVLAAPPTAVANGQP